MHRRSRRAVTASWMGAWCVLAWSVAAAADAPARTAEEELREARTAHDDAKLAAAQSRVLEEARARPDDFPAALLAAESYLLRANLLRDDRQVRVLESAVAREHRRRQAQWGESGLPHAERALALADTPARKAQAERVAGELWVHRIDGPVAGFLNGPKALAHIREALRLAPDDPECNRAIGLMYLNNPPVNGGDLEKAVKTFRKCAEAVPASDEYQLCLALTYRKRRNLDLAELSARKALALNPQNGAARHLLSSLKEKKRKGEER